MYVYWDWIVLICSCIASSGEVLQLTSSNQQALLCSFQHLTKHCLCLTFSLSLSHPDVSGAPQLQHLVPWLSQVSQRATLGHTFAIDHVSNNHQVGWSFSFEAFFDIIDKQADLNHEEVGASGFPAKKRQQQIFGTSPFLRMGRSLRQFGQTWQSYKWVNFYC